MNVNELYKLAIWTEVRYPELSTLYQELLTPLQHNATQPSKQPLEERLEALIQYLGSITFEELSIQQLRLLDDLGMASYLGAQGKKFVEKTVRTSDFDPATAAERMQEAINVINSARNRLVKYRDSVIELDVDLLDFEESDDLITIRVGFRSDASIENIADWKTSAREWYDIIRGLALASGESPETTRVVGASSGSIILFLAATATVTTLLAIISKNVTAVAKHIIEVQSEIENLRQKKLLTRVIETDLQRQIKDLTQGALESVLGEVKRQIPKLDAEAETALSNSIKKLLKFNEKGGNVDFVAPAEVDAGGDEDGEGNVGLAALAKAKEAIEEYQSVRDTLKLLTDASNDD